jgi:hypothetical protein
MNGGIAAFTLRLPRPREAQGERVNPFVLSLVEA